VDSDADWLESSTCGESESWSLWTGAALRWRKYDSDSPPRSETIGVTLRPQGNHVADRRMREGTITGYPQPGGITKGNTLFLGVYAIGYNLSFPTGNRGFAVRAVYPPCLLLGYDCFDCVSFEGMNCFTAGAML
jgi:hypothetical protein